MRLRNSSSRKNATTFSRSYSRASQASKSKSQGTSVRIVTRSLLSSASSRFPSSFPRTDLDVISSSRAKISSTGPNCRIRLAAVLSPTPLIPAMLSLESPRSALKSVMYAGLKPQRSLAAFVSYTTVSRW